MPDRQLQILLIEDNPFDAEIIQRTLARQQQVQANVVVYKDGVRALEHLEEAARNQTTPSIILLDTRLPRMNCSEILVHIRENAQLKDIRVILMPTNPDDPLVKRCVTLGTDAILAKPFDFPQFADALTRSGFDLTGFGTAAS